SQRSADLGGQRRPTRPLQSVGALRFHSQSSALLVFRKSAVADVANDGDNHQIGGPSAGHRRERELNRVLLSGFIEGRELDKRAGVNQWSVSRFNVAAKSTSMVGLQCIRDEHFDR